MIEIAPPMPAVTKFLFDTAFDAEAAPRANGAAPAGKVLLTRDELEAAKASAFAEGQQAGEAKAAAAREARMVGALQTLATQATTLVQQAEQHHQARLRDAVSIAMTALRRLMPGLMSREGGAEIETLFRDCVARLHEEPRIVVRVHDSLLDVMRDRLNGIATTGGFAGRLVMLADPALGPGDARIEWADGGVERSPAALQTEIAGAIDRYLANP